MQGLNEEAIGLVSYPEVSINCVSVPADALMELAKMFGSPDEESAEHMKWEGQNKPGFITFSCNSTYCYQLNRRPMVQMQEWLHKSSG